MVRGRLIFVSIAAAVVVGAIAAWVSHARIPDEWNPWAPLRLAEPPNFLTRYKLSRASAQDEVCRATLEQASWVYAPIADETTAPGCGYRNAVRIDRMRAAVSEPFAASCREALSLALWELHVLQPAALRHFGAPVTRIEHFGSYSCRGVYGRPNARRSHHATADALDVAGFVIGEARRVRVLSAWPSDGAEGRFVREAHAGACKFFDSVFGPDYNAAHRDHLHLDRGAFRSCR